MPSAPPDPGAAVTEARALFDRLWGFYTTRLDANAVSAFDYVEQVTYLLYLKIDHERAGRRLNPVRAVPVELDWAELLPLSGGDLDQHYGYLLNRLSRENGTTGSVFRKAVSAVRDPADLQALIHDVIAPTSWSRLPPAVLSEMYDMLIDRAATTPFNMKSGQTLTPRPLVAAAITCLRPTSDDTVLDPACGTGGILVAAHMAMTGPTNGDEATEEVGGRLAPDAVMGADLDERMVRLAAMNVLLSTGRPFTEPVFVECADSLAMPSRVHPTVIVCNPPFRSTAPQPMGRHDFVADTPIIQLNFLQHIVNTLRVGGRAAVFVPDNVLFGSGAARRVREWLLRRCDVHTLLRLPTGVFERTGVKTNILFFDKATVNTDGSPATRRLWVYDLRTGMNFQRTKKPLTASDLADFLHHYRPADGERTASERFRAFDYADLAVRDFNLDLTWRQATAEHEAEPAAPEDLAREITDELGSAFQEFDRLAASLDPEASAGRFLLVDRASPVADVVQLIQSGELDALKLAEALSEEDEVRKVLAAFASIPAGFSAAEIAVIGQRRETIKKARELVLDPATKEADLQRVIGECHWLFGGQYVGVSKRRNIAFGDEYDIPLLRADGTLHIIELKQANVPKLVRDHRSHLIAGTEVHEAASQAMNYLRTLDSLGAGLETELRNELGLHYTLRRVFATVIIGHPQHADEKDEQKIRNALRTYNASLARVEVITYEELLDAAERALKFEEAEAGG